MFRRATTGASLEYLCTHEDLSATAAGSKQMETFLYWKISPVLKVQSENQFKITSNKHKLYKAKTVGETTI
jgi:hypothetical protein